MRNRLTRLAMGKDDSPTTMHVDVANPDVSKYESGNPESWGEGVSKEHPWQLENEKGREETGHAKKVRESSHNTYASAVKEAQDLEAKALRCLKMAEVMLGDDAPADVIERQAVDFMTMSNKSVLATLRRMREFEETISETRVAKIVDAVLEVIAEEEEEEKKEEKEEKKASSEETEDSKIAAIVEATLEVLAEEEEEEKKEEKEEKKASSEEELISKITASVLAALGKTSKEEEMKEEKKAEKEEEKEEKKASEEISFEDGMDVSASDEDAALLSQLFTTKEADEESTTKEAKIKTLKSVTASTTSVSEIDRLASLWNKE